MSVALVAAALSGRGGGGLPLAVDEPSARPAITP
jgi:hypothetical protein